MEHSKPISRLYFGNPRTNFRSTGILQQPVASTAAIQEQPSGLQGSYNISQRDTANQPVASTSATKEQPSGLQRSDSISKRDTINQPVASSSETQEQPLGLHGPYSLCQWDKANQPDDNALAIQEWPGTQAMTIRKRNRRFIEAALRIVFPASNL